MSNILGTFSKDKGPKEQLLITENHICDAMCKGHSVIPENKMPEGNQFRDGTGA